MNTPRTNGDEGDRELSALYRQAPRPEPRAAIDDAILAASRRPSASRRRAARAAGRRRTFVSVAAMVLVAVILAPALYHQVRTPPQERMTRGVAPMVEERDAPLPVPGDAAPKAESEPAADSPAGAPAAAPAPQELRFEAPPGDASRTAPVRQRAAEAERLQSAPAAAPAPGPGEMLSRIEALVEAGDLEGARALLARLRERFPGFPVDEALLHRLDTR